MRQHDFIEKFVAGRTHEDLERVGLHCRCSECRVTREELRPTLESEEADLAAAESIFSALEITTSSGDAG